MKRPARAKKDLKLHQIVRQEDIEWATDWAKHGVEWHDADEYCTKCGKHLTPGDWPWCPHERNGTYHFGGNFR